MDAFTPKLYDNSINDSDAARIITNPQVRTGPYRIGPGRQVYSVFHPIRGKSHVEEERH